ncbi:TetR/AcrR family transcriptional regulator [Nocardia brasiliensis]|uniref:TetR/AcrR family transcriptional regulator n=1 Tax=Nocardia brasiliensis TaxID=37326 RepID=UPI00245569E6|nr:TetR/AcrR family transcriptional regulator [Nocardia brasiliensis]
MPTSQQKPYHHGDLRAALLQEAESALREVGVERLSLREVSRAVGVSNGAPRRHFRSKEEMLDSLAAVGFSRLGAAIRSVSLAPERSFRERFAELAAAHFAFARENMALMELMFSRKLAQHDSTDLAEKAYEAYKPSLDLIVTGQAEGTVVAGDPVQISLTFFATIQGLAGLAASGMVDQEIVTNALDAAVRLYLDGITPR